MSKLQLRRFGKVGQEGMPPWLSKAEVRRCGLPLRVTFRDILNTHHESTGQREVMKYLRESCHYRIKCSVANFLITLMWK